MRRRSRNARPKAWARALTISAWTSVTPTLRRTGWAAAWGGVVLLAARRLKARVLGIAASLLGLNSPEALDVANGDVVRFVSGAWEATGLTLAAIGRTAHLDPVR